MSAGSVLFLHVHAQPLTKLKNSLERLLRRAVDGPEANADDAVHRVRQLLERPIRKINVAAASSATATPRLLDHLAALARRLLLVARAAVADLDINARVTPALNKLLVLGLGRVAFFVFCCLC